jgi:predicted N-acetyltransferase YhbS
MSDTPRPTPLQLIPEPDMPDATDEAIRQLLCLCFPADAAAFVRRRAWHESVPAFSVISFDGDTVVGHVAIVLRAVRCGQHEPVVAGVQNMCVSPKRRGAGLARALLRRALHEAEERGVEYGLLFCEAALEPFYRDQGWRKLSVPVTMADEYGVIVPIPEKNIAMLIALTDKPFPAGPIELAGRDW